MAKASDNQFPYVHLVPAAAPVAPTAGQRLYLDSADANKLKRKDTAGVVTTVEGGGGAATVWLGAAAMGAVSGAPTLGNIESTLPAWLLDAAANETIGGSTEIPSDWTTFHADVYWAPTTTGTGDAHLDAGQAFITPGVTWASTYVSAGVSTAPGIVNRVVSHRLITGLSRTGNVLGVRVVRAATAAGDTYAADAAILGVRFTKAS